VTTASPNTIVVPHGFEANYTLGFVKGLKASQMNFCVLSCDATDARLKANGIVSLNLRGSLDENRSVFDKWLNLGRYYARVIFFLLRHPGRTVHFTGIFRNQLILFEGLLFNLALRLLARRYVYTAHNVLPHSREHSRLFRAVYRWVYRIPHVILVTTQKARAQLINEFSVDPNKIHIMSIGLNEEIPMTGLARSEARRRLGLDESDNVILFFGKMDEYKGLDILLEAFAQLDVPDARLLIGGAFRSDEYRARIFHMIEASPARSSIILKEASIPNEEVEIFFRAADVCCLPYRNIYQSGVIFVAMRFGVPIVATDVGSLREFVDDTVGVIAATNDAVGIAAALRAFFSGRGRFRPEVIILGAYKYRCDNICRMLIPLYQSV
jgi:glycosyltransferase involved in cell wall biosynthesis